MSRLIYKHHLMSTVQCNMITSFSSFDHIGLYRIYTFHQVILFLIAVKRKYDLVFHENHLQLIHKKYQPSFFLKMMNSGIFTLRVSSVFFDQC